MEYSFSNKIRDVDTLYDDDDEPNERLTDFRVFKNSEKYNISDVWDDKEKPLYNQKMGYAFIDKNYNLTDDMTKAVRFVGIVGGLEATPLLEKSYSSITYNSLHNKRVVISGIQLEIPMKWIEKDLPDDGKGRSSILKIKFDKARNTVTYYTHIDSKHLEFSDSNYKKKDKFFDLGRYHICKDERNNDRCVLKVNNFIIYPFSTHSDILHNKKTTRKKSHLHT